MLKITDSNTTVLSDLESMKMSKLNSFLLCFLMVGTFNLKAEEENELNLARLERAQAKLLIKITDKRGRLNSFEAKRAERILSEFQEEDIKSYTLRPFHENNHLKSVVTN